MHTQEFQTHFPFQESGCRHVLIILVLQLLTHNHCSTHCVLFQEGVGLIAINDSFCLEGAIYQLLKKHFHSEPYYVNILELFHEVGIMLYDLCVM